MGTVFYMVFAHMLSLRSKSSQRNMSEKPKLREINAANKIAYDAVAAEYAERRQLSMKNDPEFVKDFLTFIDEGFPGIAHEDLAVLDIGVGSGLNLRMFDAERYKTYGIDISDKLIGEAKKESPNTLYYHGDFLEYRLSRKFHGIMAKAFIHLFPEEIAREMLQKMYDNL